MTETITPQARVARGATFVFIQGILNAALGVVYVWFLTHTEEISGQLLFTESDFGLFAMLSFMFTLTTTLGVLALRTAAVRYIAHYIAEGEKDRAKSVVNLVLRVSLVTSLSIVALLLVLSGTLAGAFESPPVVFQLLPVSSAFQVFFFQALGFLQGLQKIREYAIISMFYSVTHYAISLVLVYAGFGILAIVAGWVLGLIMSFVLSIVTVFRNMSSSTNVHPLLPLLRFSFPIYISMILTFIVGWVDQILLFAFLSQEALGVYNLAVKAAIVPNLVSTAIITSLFPKLSELRSVSGLEGLKYAFRISTRYAALVGFPLAIMVATLSYPIMILFATVRFVDAVIPLAIMCIAAIPSALNAATSPTLLSMDRTKRTATITLAVIVLEGVFSYTSLKYFGAGLGGVALSRLLAGLGGFLLGVYALRTILEIEFDLEAISKAALASVIMVLSLFLLEFLRSVIYPTSYQFLVLRIRQLPIYVVVGAAAYLVALIALRALRNQDVQLLHDYLPPSLRRATSWLRRIARLRE
jgi:O-antigen/teichoic acid export membrane protein